MDDHKAILQIPVHKKQGDKRYNLYFLNRGDMVLVFDTKTLLKMNSRKTFSNIQQPAGKNFIKLENQRQLEKKRKVCLFKWVHKERRKW